MSPGASILFATLLVSVSLKLMIAVATNGWSVYLALARAGITITMLSHVQPSTACIGGSSISLVTSFGPSNVSAWLVRSTVLLPNCLLAVMIARAARSRLYQQ